MTIQPDVSWPVSPEPTQDPAEGSTHVYDVLAAPLSPRPGFVGRDAELRRLRTFLRQARAHGAAQVVLGTAGSGKTELLNAVVELADGAGGRVLRCAGIRGGSPSPLSALPQLIWPVLAAGSTTARREARLLESLLVGGEGAAETDPRLPFAVFRALVSAAEARPLLVTVDDWDALDAASREILSFSARRTEGTALGFLIGSRSDHPQDVTLAGLPEIALGPLSTTDATSLLAQRRPGNDPHTVSELLATAAGNPLALLELPAATDESAPHRPLSSDRLAAALTPEAPRLPARTRDLLLVAALHPEAELPLLLAAAGRLAETALDFADLEPAELARIVHIKGARLVFRHPATAGAAIHGVALEQCRRAHAALAAELPEGSAEHLWHLSQSVDGPDPALADRLASVSHLALERGQTLGAVRLLQRAAQLHPDPTRRGPLTLQAAQLASDLGMPHLARRLAHRASRLPLPPLARLHSRALTDAPDHKPSQTDPGTWPAPQEDGETDSALALARLTAPSLVRDTAGAQALLRYLDRLPGVGTDPRSLHVEATVAPMRRGAVIVRRLAAVGGLSTMPLQHVEQFAEAALYAGDPVRALDLQRQAEQRHLFRGTADQLPRLLVRQAVAHLALGDWSQAEQTLHRCRALADRHAQGDHAAAAHCLAELTCGLRTGQVVTFRDSARLEAARRSFGGIDDLLALGVALAQVEGGDFPGGFATLSALLREPGSGAGTLFGLVPFAEAAAHLGAGPEAQELLDRWERAVLPDPSPLAAVQLAVARALAADDTEAEALFTASCALDLHRWPSLEAMLRLAHGRWLRRRHQLAHSRVTLRRAATGFAVMGADARAARIAAELRASGERPDRGALPVVDRAGAARLLSAQELRIARLAGQGLSNREIGEQLHLSPRTIGSHLYRVFPRLGVTSRAQLAEVVGSTAPSLRPGAEGRSRSALAELRRELDA
ncbi:AAA family ATPase [Streptacidiphilus anmyonensis]|uniref:AAA family ATPase n=1 Tax=Streptacidiphilus anmyonensis TaxID=405782 RepID=UPI0007C7075B|nr:LuxR family transcriptional regulator [Streptacidiphilus anmyonensis]